MKIARVFPTKTSMSPTDADAYFGTPGLFTPVYDEVHISVLFTWDIPKAEWLRREWERIAPVKIGGPAIDGELSEPFIPSLYVNKGNIITSRGCPNRCQWCFIRNPLVELEICQGNNILDNNILACSPRHIDSLFLMLSHEKDIKFTGGLEADRITDKLAERLRALRLTRVYLAYDHPSRLNGFKRAVRTLRKHLSREQVSAYVLIGHGDDTFDKAEGRLREAWEIGTMPFAMLYRNHDGAYPQPEKEWRRFQRSWCRPAAIRSTMKSGKAGE
ncbi:MAG: hypothetical protein PHC68_02605 [Syntrophorhabdaceae bacterium]|nr:hypothetical protein [Syntrophorhabdaceae bacterium]